MKQGDPISSILCLFYLNDVLNDINGDDGMINVGDIQLYMLLFADDAVVFARNPQTLQPILNNIEHYCDIWKLKLNVSKSKVMIFEN